MGLSNLVFVVEKNEEKRMFQRIQKYSRMFKDSFNSLYLGDNSDSLDMFLHYYRSDPHLSLNLSCRSNITKVNVFKEVRKFIPCYIFCKSGK